MDIPTSAAQMTQSSNRSAMFNDLYYCSLPAANERIQTRIYTRSSTTTVAAAGKPKIRPIACACKLSWGRSSVDESMAIRFTAEA